MKITIDVDCTPEEARTFLGLPDVRPVQEAMMAEVERRMMHALDSMDPETVLKTWLPVGLQGFEQMQKAFWSNFGGGSGSGGSKDKG